MDIVSNHFLTCYKKEKKRKRKEKELMQLLKGDVKVELIWKESFSVLQMLTGPLILPNVCEWLMKGPCNALKTSN